MKSDTPRTDEAENNQYYEGYVESGFARALEREVNLLRKLLSGAKDALCFYADEHNWKLKGPCDANSGNFYAITHAEKAISSLKFLDTGRDEE